MAAVLVRLKLALLRRTFQRDGAALVGVVVGGLFAAVFVGIGALMLVSTRAGSPQDARALVVPLLATVTLGWVIGPLVMFGSDETLDPGRFALFPLNAQRLRPGLLIAGLIGIPGAATSVLALAQIVPWTRGVGSVLVATAAAVLGVTTCFLASRVVTTMFSRALSSRKMRDVAAVFLGIFAAGAGLSNQAISRLASSAGSTHSGHAAQLVADITGWTPMGWAWSAPADVACGRMVPGLAKLALAVALVAALWWAWGHFLDRALESPLTASGGGEVSSSDRLTRLTGGGPTGAIMGRCLKYWRRDPRYLSALASFVMLPLVMGFTSLGHGGVMLLLAPVFLVAVATPTLQSDIAYDNSAFWLHVSTGVSMRADRWGRTAALGVMTVPLTLVASTVLAGVTGRWDALPWSVALVIAVAGCGAGASLLAGAYLPGQAPVPGGSAFGKGASGGGVRVFLALFGAWLSTAVLVSPVIVLAALGYGWIALAVAPFLAALVLTVGVRLSARQLERTLPEILTKVTR